MERNEFLSKTNVSSGPPRGTEDPLFGAPQDVVDPLGRNERHRQFGPLLEFSPDAIVIVDADGLVRECNPAAQLMLQTGDASEIHAPLRDLLCAAHREAFDTAWLELLGGQVVQHVKAPPRLDAVAEQPLDLTLAQIRSGGKFVGAVVILRDATEQPAPVAQTEAPTRTHAVLGPVTAEFDGPAGLPGRHWLQRCLSETQATGYERGVAVFDIDAFAVMVTTYGPDAAHAVLTQFGELLKSLDTPGAFAHWRADSFVWIVDAADPVSALDEWIATMTKALKEPFQVGEDRVWITLSIGLATTTLVVDGDLLAAASDAMQSAKATGGSSAVYYDQSLDASASSGFRLANGLRYAIEHDELRLHYQPIMDFATNEIVGVEALVRWERPGVGLLTPVAFIDAAERTGLIVPLGNWVVRTACNNALRLGSHSGGPRTMSINISAGQLHDPGLITTLREAMLEGSSAPSTIVIEVTESVLLDDLNAIAASLEAIKALDVGVDLDDFGTGYSSLQYLRNLPIDRLKVDQGFIAGLGVNGADTAIVASTIALAHALGLGSIAEGVETSEQLALLREMGCDFAQGYLLSRPADMETFTQWLDAYVPAEVLPAAYSHSGSDADGRRDKKADARDSRADRRDVKSATRDAKANIRDTSATARDTEASIRELTADSRDATADARERIADLRDAVAAERENDEDERESASGSSGSSRGAGDSSSNRRTAERDRIRASVARKVEASNRARVGKRREEASAGRASRARARAQKRAAQPVAPHLKMLAKWVRVPHVFLLAKRWRYGLWFWRRRGGRDGSESR